MFTILFKQFFRAKSTWMSLLLLLSIGCFSIAVGKQHLNKQADNISRIEKFQKEHIDRNIQYFNNEIGLLLYYIKFALVNTTDPLNGLSVGQRDVNSSIQSINIRNLEAQRYDTDLNNPSALYAGNLDLSFVVIYLFPLVIIAFVFNLLSEEKERGTLKLWLIQSRKPMKILWIKLLIRFLAITVVLMFLFFIAYFSLPLKWNEKTIAFIVLSYLYVSIWFAIGYWVVSWQQNSNTNAVSLLSIWIFLTLVLPASINNYIIYMYPLPEAQQLALEQRDGYHEKWDMSKASTMKAFYQHYPQFEQYGIPDEKAFSWLWYYAMQQMGDDDAAPTRKKLFYKLWQRQNAALKLSAFVPTLHTQIQLTDLSQAGLRNHLLFLDSTAKFHENKRLYFYPKIFSDQPVEQEKWSSFTVSFFEERTKLKWFELVFPLVAFGLVCYLLGLINFKRRSLIVVS
ncbi:MAG: DUF3526 domain-containing protein [Chitinophagaceae bacterium]|nr:DUF3526 domain-containing protein [Chitinophagaceae bacterium]